MSSTFLQIATIEHEQKGKKLYIDKEKDGTYIPMEVQDNSAAYEGFITPKNKKRIIEGAALKLPPGLNALRTLRGKVLFFTAFYHYWFGTELCSKFCNEFTLAFFFLLFSISFDNLPT